MENYTNSSSMTKAVDSFVAAHVQPELLTNNNYMMYFFRESEKTNLKKIKENPRIIDRYSTDHDLIFTYYWEEGKFKGREKIKNGEVIEPKQKKISFTVKQLPH